MQGSAISGIHLTNYITKKPLTYNPSAVSMIGSVKSQPAGMFPAIHVNSNDTRMFQPNYTALQIYVKFGSRTGLIIPPVDSDWRRCIIA